MKPEKLYLELEELIERLGYRTRKERGSFRGGFCVVEGDKLIMLNKNHPIEYQVGMLARFLESQSELNELFMKPAVRFELEKLWNQKQREVIRTNPLLKETDTE